MPKPIKKQTWSRIDVFGLLNGLSIWDSQYRTLKYVRRPFDSNLDLRAKLFRQHDNPADTTKQGLINALSNEFEYTPYNVQEKRIFELSYRPIASGAANVEDIKAYYKIPGSDTWNSIPQVWSSGYLQAKESNRGFIVWQQEKYNDIQGTKNFTYSNVAEVMHFIPDKSEIKFIYYLTDYDEENNKFLVQFTDINNPNDPEDNRFTYRKENNNPNLESVLAYTLKNIPENVYSGLYYDKENKPRELLYTIKEHIDKKFKHKWGQIVDRECIWNVHKLYGSGHIPHFYDSEAPDNSSWCYQNYTGYFGGIEELSDALYPSEITETSGNQEWYLRVFPGRFYIDGVPYYYFENPQTSYISFSGGEADLPSGLERGMYTIMALSGYYSSYCNDWKDPYLSGIYEDYNYPTGKDGDVCWTHIYRKRPYITAQYDHAVSLKEGEYNIDFDSGKIYGNSINDAIIIWDEVLQPSGSILAYDLNPLNDQNLTFEKFFLFLSLDR